MNTVALWALLGCRPSVEALVNEAIPTVVTLRWESTLAGNASVLYGQSRPELSTPMSESSGQQHEVVVYGLKAGQDVALQGVVRDELGNEERTEVVELSLDPPPADLPRFTLTHDSAGLLPGYVLLSLLEPGQGWLVILDQDADPVWFWKVQAALTAMSPSVSLDGSSILFDHYDIQNRTDISGMTRVALDGTDAIQTRLFQGHHDYAELPEGEIAWISVDLREVQHEGETVLVAGDSVLVGAEGGSEATGSERFSFWNRSAPYEPCEHFDGDAHGTGGKDWTHANSLMYLPEDDSLVVLSKNLDALVAFDAFNGEVRWQIGGRDETMQFTQAGRAWSHGHMSQIWDDGFVIFDNGYHNGAISRASEYRFDISAGTYERVWDYAHPDEAFIPLLGDVKKLPDDSYLVSWTSIGTLSRLDATGEILWQAEAELGAATGRALFIEDLYTLR